MLTGKQRSYLRGLANTVQPIFQVGKGGINENIVKQFDDALEARELIKASVLRNSLVDTEQVSKAISNLTHSEVVQVIGNKFVLYRESKQDKAISLPE